MRSFLRFSARAPDGALRRRASTVVANTACLVLSLSGCFLVGYDGVPPKLEFDAGHLSEIKNPDAARSDEDAGQHDAGRHDDAGTDAAMDAGDDLDASMDAALDGQVDGGDGGQTDAQTSLDGSVTDAAASDGSVDDGGHDLPDAGGDAGHADAGPDAGPPPVDPMPHCQGTLPTTSCLLECTDIPVCSPFCDTMPGACDIDCSGTGTCNPVCNGSLKNECAIDCRNTGRCNAKCEGAGDCHIDCRGSDRCNEARCEDYGTQCKITCDPGTPNCGFAYCWGDPNVMTALGPAKQRVCPDGKTVVCGAYPCP